MLIKIVVLLFFCISAFGQENSALKKLDDNSLNTPDVSLPEVDFNFLRRAERDKSLMNDPKNMYKLAEEMMKYEYIFYSKKVMKKLELKENPIPRYSLDGAIEKLKKAAPKQVMAEFQNVERSNKRLREGFYSGMIMHLMRKGFFNNYPDIKFNEEILKYYLDYPLEFFKKGRTIYQKRYLIEKAKWLYVENIIVSFKGIEIEQDPLSKSAIKSVVDSVQLMAEQEIHRSMTEDGVLEYIVLEVMSPFIKNAKIKLSLKEVQGSSLNKAKNVVSSEFRPVVRDEVKSIVPFNLPLDIYLYILTALSSLSLLIAVFALIRG